MNGNGQHYELNTDVCAACRNRLRDTCGACEAEGKYRFLEVKDDLSNFTLPPMRSMIDDSPYARLALITIGMRKLARES